MLVMGLRGVRAALRSGQNARLVAAEDLQKGWRVHRGWGLLGLACRAKHPLQRCAPVRASVICGCQADQVQTLTAGGGGAVGGAALPSSTGVAMRCLAAMTLQTNNHLTEWIRLRLHKHDAKLYHLTELMQLWYVSSWHGQLIWLQRLLKTYQH